MVLITQFLAIIQLQIIQIIQLQIRIPGSDQSSIILQILKSYFLNFDSDPDPEFWSNLTLWSLSHESGLMVCNFEPKIFE